LKLEAFHLYFVMRFGDRYLFLLRDAVRSHFTRYQCSQTVT